MSKLILTVTDFMADRFRHLNSFRGQKFNMTRMLSEYDGCCVITGRLFPADSEIGFTREKCADGKMRPIVAIATEIEKQMKDLRVGVEKPEAPAARLDSKSHRIPADRISGPQKQASDIFENESCNLIEESRAGGGKTTMLRHHASYRKENEKFVYLAFNKKNAKEGKKKLPPTVPSLTTHSFMGDVIRSNGLKIGFKADKTKTMQILNELFPAMNNKQRKKIRRATSKLVGLAKAYACKHDDYVGIGTVMDQYRFDLEKEDDSEAVIELTSNVLQMSMPSSKYGLMYDYNDMLYWPIVLEMVFPKYNVILADECQDFNVCQIEMLRNLGIMGARLVIVGDPFQAIYRFRGADSKAWGKLCAVLEESPRGAKRVLFPTNYRCPKKVLAYVRDNTHVKDIEAAPNAIEGDVRENMTYTQVIEALVAEYGGRAA